METSRKIAMKPSFWNWSTFHIVELEEALGSESDNIQKCLFAFRHIRVISRCSPYFVQNQCNTMPVKKHFACKAAFPSNNYFCWSICSCQRSFIPQSIVSEIIFGWEHWWYLTSTKSMLEQDPGKESMSSKQACFNAEKILFCFGWESIGNDSISAACIENRFQFE